MSQVFPQHILIIKLIYKVFGFIIKICWGKTSDMHKRAFQGLKCTFMHVPGLLSAYFDLKNQKLYKLVLLSKYARRRPETCINVRFRAWNARLSMSQVFPQHILIIKLIYKVFGFIIKICWGKTWDMHKRAFQGLKRTFIHVSGLPAAYFDNKTNLKSFWFFIKIWWGKTWDMRKRAFQALKRTLMHVSGLPPAYFDNKTNLQSFWFYYQNMLGEDLRHA